MQMEKLKTVAIINDKIESNALVFRVIVRAFILEETKRFYNTEVSDYQIHHSLTQRFVFNMSDLFYYSTFTSLCLF